jgi:hypothetical protein
MKPEWLAPLPLPLTVVDSFNQMLDLKFTLQ